VLVVGNVGPRVVGELGDFDGRVGNIGL